MVIVIKICQHWNLFNDSWRNKYGQLVEQPESYFLQSAHPMFYLSGNIKIWQIFSSFATLAFPERAGYIQQHVILRPWVSTIEGNNADLFG